MYERAMKPVITKALDLDITHLSTYKGYDGANILKVIFKDPEVLVVLRSFCKAKSIATSVKVMEPLVLFCIFEVSDDIYALK